MYGLEGLPGGVPYIFSDSRRMFVSRRVHFLKWRNFFLSPLLPGQPEGPFTLKIAVSSQLTPGQLRGPESLTSPRRETGVRTAQPRCPLHSTLTFLWRCRQLLHELTESMTRDGRARKLLRGQFRTSL